MRGKLFKALRGAGVGDDLAREAAEEVANYYGIERLERKLDGLDFKVDRLAAAFETKLNLLSWVLGLISLITAGVLWKVLTL